ncbi:MAG: hypothetical protein K6G50_11560 [bacterium]|nr:hypothetical protein [bacterium]
MYKNIPGYVEFLDLNHRYYIVIALKEGLESEIYTCHFYDDSGDINDNYLGFWFNEKVFLLMEKYLFNFINQECGLLINMYEEEYADPEQLPKILEITNRMICNSDNDVFLEYANQFKAIVEKAIELQTIVGFCF